MIRSRLARALIGVTARDPGAASIVISRIHGPMIYETLFARDAGWAPARALTGS